MSGGDPKYIFFNGQIIPYGEAKVHVMTPAMKYGATVFEGIRGYWSIEKEDIFLFRLEDHLLRLLQSVRLMRMEFNHTLEQMAKWVISVVRANELRQDMHIRQMVFVEGRGPSHACSPVGMSIAAMPMDRFYDAENGIKASVSSWERIAESSMPARIKCAANYQNSRLASLQANLDGYDIAIFLNSRGKVSETVNSCAFIVKAGTVITPTVTNDILEGITRDTALRICSDQLGIPAVEREIDRTELYSATEVFICGSAVEITPVVEVDCYKIGDGRPGEITRQLQGAYQNIVRGKVRGYDRWLTPVYGS